MYCTAVFCPVRTLMLDPAEQPGRLMPTDHTCVPDAAEQPGWLMPTEHNCMPDAAEQPGRSTYCAPSCRSLTVLVSFVCWPHTIVREFYSICHYLLLFMVGEIHITGRLNNLTTRSPFFFFAGDSIWIFFCGG
jgi:hypothetical protein